MNFIETLKSVGGVKPCHDCRGIGELPVAENESDEGDHSCARCHGTGQVLDLAPLLAKPKMLEPLVTELVYRKYGDISGTDWKVENPEVFIVGPQRASNLIYEVARQLGGTAVVVESIPVCERKSFGSVTYAPYHIGVDFRLSLPIPPDATVLFVTDRLTEGISEMDEIIKAVGNVNSLLYVLALVSDTDGEEYPYKDSTAIFKVISLYQEK